MAMALLCLRKPKARAVSVRGQYRRGAHPSMAIGDDVLVAGLFHPLNNRPQVLKCLQRGETTLEDLFCFQKKIGKGGFSEVWLARYQKKPKEDPVAIKLIARNKMSNAEVVNEMTVLKAVHNCPFVVQMVSNFRSSTHYGIVMKYATGGTLHERVQMVRRFSELVARFYSAEIAEGLFGLHNRGVIHRDLNLDNVLIGDDGHVILSDFGLSLLRDPDELNIPCEPWPEAAKAQFPAPELLLGLEYDKTVDWWSFGVILYRMVCGEYPFLRRKKTTSAKNSDYSLEVIYKAEDYPTYLSSQAKSIIRVLLSRRKIHRLGRGQYEENDVSNMDFFYNVDWCQLREHSVPAPFADMVYHGPKRHKRPSMWHLAISNMPPATPVMHSPGGASPP